MLPTLVSFGTTSASLIRIPELSLKLISTEISQLQSKIPLMASETTSLESTSMISEELTDSLMACNSILTSDCLNLNKPQINILLSCITYS